jgi:RecB family exonuclease
VSPPYHRDRRRRLIRTRGLAEFRQTLLHLALSEDGESLEGERAGGVSSMRLAAARRAFVLPSRAAAGVFLHTLERTAIHSGRQAFIAPALLTREEWLARLHEDVPGAPPLLTRFEREILMERAAHGAAARALMPRAPFPLRPALIAEMLGLYDELRRRQHTVGGFVHTLFDELRVERGTDRGAEGLLHQTCFLGFAFLAYERGVKASGALDEHLLRARLVQQHAPMPFDHLVVAVADHPADPRGLWPSDFDLIGRLPGRFDLDVVLTDEIHDAGFRARLEHELPGIEEVRRQGGEAAAPLLVRPPDDAGEALCWTHRDREEELREIARGIRARAGSTAHELRESTAVVFQRPLPYLYLSQQVLGEAGVPFQAFESLPLAGEPYAALLDLVLDAARTGGTRESIVALLRSPLLHFAVSDEPVALEDAAALDVVLTERRASGDAESYLREVEQYFSGHASRGRLKLDRAVRAAHAATAIAEALRPFRDALSASQQLVTIARFLQAHQQMPCEDDVWRERYLRGRAAILTVVNSLAHACRLHDDRPRPPEALSALVRHWMERHTFAPLRAPGGVHLVDAIAARFGCFDHVHLVGLVENEWPERPRRTIFYTAGLLRALGWPQERDHTLMQRAAFRDLLSLPTCTLQLHAFQFEGDAIVASSPLVELARSMPWMPAPGEPPRAIFSDELLTGGGPLPAGLPADRLGWLDLRMRRPPLTDRCSSGFIGARPPEAYRVSRVDRYVDCPFKYFAEHVLGLPDEREEFSGLSPLERGTLVHTLFEAFYRQWQTQGRRAITPETLPDAIELFGRLTREHLAALPAADRALEEARLLGSIVARGMAERVFELESDAGGEIVDRLIEFPLEGTFSFPKLNGLAPREIAIRGKADRIDVFSTGALRVIDYKLSRLPDTDSSIQIAVYAYAVQQLLEARDGRPHPVSEAMYLAFGDERQTQGPLAAPGEATSAAVVVRASAFADAIERIEAGEFPPRPRKVSDCQWCRYSGVCRKEYVVEEAEQELGSDMP